MLKSFFSCPVANAVPRDIEYMSFIIKSFHFQAERDKKMSRYSSSYYGFAPYVSVSEKQSRNRKAVGRLRKKKPTIQPVEIEGRRIASEWWGKSWTKNLERYADYSNRISRGRSYVRHGAVLDLQIGDGTVRALVQGSRSKPYEVEIRIDPLPDRTWEHLKEGAMPRLDSLSELLSGKFPKDLQAIFFAREDGIFPSPKEIAFECSCPDLASMCKHVAAVLYGVGNRLDHAPELLFKLRGVSVEELVSRAVESTAENLISKAETAETHDTIADDDLQEVFGIELDGGKGTVELPSVASFACPDTEKKEPRKPRRTRKAVKNRRKKEIVPQAGMMTDQLLKVAAKRKKSFTLDDLSAQLPLWSRTQITNTLQRGLRSGHIERVRRGIYKLAK